jgi:Zn-dependent protease with chaperone function
VAFCISGPDMGAITILFVVWVAWAALNAALLVLSPWIVPDRAGAFTNGLVIVVPEALRSQLTANELAAIEAHEQGHIAHMHALKNCLRSCLLLPRPKALAMQQELEADAFAESHGHRLALASALRRMSSHPFDLDRARLLDPWHEAEMN